MQGNIQAESQWEKQRLYKFTASQIGLLFSEPKSKEAKQAGELSETAKKYVYAKAAELMTGFRRDIMTFSTEYGNNFEPEAASELKKYFPNLEYKPKEQQEFIEYTDFSGGTPDFWDVLMQTIKFPMTGDIKCPENYANYVEYAMFKDQKDLKKCNSDYYYQIHFNMAVVAKKFGFKYEDMRGLFVSYCPIVDQKLYPNIAMLGLEPDMEFYNKLESKIIAATEYFKHIIYDVMLPMKENGVSIPFLNEQPKPIQEPVIQVEKQVSDKPKLIF